MTATRRPSGFSLLELLIVQRARMEVERWTRRPRREEVQTPLTATTQRRRRHSGRGFTPTMLKYVIEHAPPQRRAKFVESVKDMRERWSGRRRWPPLGRVFVR